VGLLTLVQERHRLRLPAERFCKKNIFFVTQAALVVCGLGIRCFDYSQARKQERKQIEKEKHSFSLI